MTTPPLPVPEGAEESFVVREAVRRLNLIEAQRVHERNRRLERLCQEAGIDPESAPDLRDFLRRDLRGEAA